MVHQKTVFLPSLANVLLPKELGMSVWHAPFRLLQAVVDTTGNDAIIIR